VDRRSGESAAAAQHPERRATADRRSTDRRVMSMRRRGRRRRDTPTPYSAEEVEVLRARFRTPGPIECPSCGAAFTLGLGRRRPGTGHPVRRVTCLGCGRAAVLESPHVARVLIVEANAPLRDSMHSALISAGHEVIETDDAGVALHAYQAAPADVVLLDVRSSGRMQATEFLRRLRGIFPDARVITLAGRPSFRETDPLALMQGLGAVGALRMPLSRELLLRAVEEARS
jgi:CheY-like chemotaxis protein